MFEAIKGRPPTDQELADYRAAQAAVKPSQTAPDGSGAAQARWTPSERGRPMKLPPGTGIGISGMPRPAPKAPIKDAIAEALHLRKIVAESDAELVDAFRRSNDWTDPKAH
jgi:hypothetical protein